MQKALSRIETSQLTLLEIEILSPCRTSALAEYPVHIASLNH
ncbi:hypothetical protein SAMN04488490_0873 [Marinobacter sp. LV10R510-11A]|nr:hypothetical protein SAMN04488490_0873 [Marinobacter sp. LV10R510-11A]